MKGNRRELLKYGAATVLAGIGAPSALAGPIARSQRGDEVWFVNSHAVPCGRLTEAHNRCWSVSRMIPGSAWQRTSLEDFYASSADGRLTVFWVHGHHTDSAFAMQSGWMLYKSLIQACPTAPPPLRLVIYKWPSEQTYLRPVVDARAKSSVADYEGYKLGYLLGHIPSSTPVSLAGFSFGPRVITGALHLLGGGSLCGQRLNAYHPHQARVVLWAAALHNYWPAQGNWHGRAIYSTDAMLNLHNSNDIVLKRYHRLDTSARPQALGYAGMPASWLGSQAYRFAQRNVCNEVGRHHRTMNYLGSPSVMSSTRPYLLWHTA